MNRRFRLGKNNNNNNNNSNGSSNITQSNVVLPSALLPTTIEDESLVNSEPFPGFTPHQRSRSSSQSNSHSNASVENSSYDEGLDGIPSTEMKNMEPFPELPDASGKASNSSDVEYEEGNNFDISALIQLRPPSSRSTSMSRRSVNIEVTTEEDLDIAPLLEGKIKMFTGKGLKPWKERYLLARGGRLYHYADRESENAIGFINLLALKNIVKQPNPKDYLELPKKGNYTNAFALIMETDKYFFMVDNKQQQEHWTSTILKIKDYWVLKSENVPADAPQRPTKKSDGNLMSPSYNVPSEYIDRFNVVWDADYDYTNEENILLFQTSLRHTPPFQCGHFPNCSSAEDIINMTNQRFEARNLSLKTHTFYIVEKQGNIIVISDGSFAFELKRSSDEVFILEKHKRPICLWTDDQNFTILLIDQNATVESILNHTVLGNRIKSPAMCMKSKNDITDSQLKSFENIYELAQKFSDSTFWLLSQKNREDASSTNFGGHQSLSEAEENNEVIGSGLESQKESNIGVEKEPEVPVTVEEKKEEELEVETETEKKKEGAYLYNSLLGTNPGYREVAQASRSLNFGYLDPQLVVDDSSDSSNNLLLDAPIYSAGLPFALLKLASISSGSHGGSEKDLLSELETEDPADEYVLSPPPSLLSSSSSKKAQTKSLKELSQKELRSLKVSSIVSSDKIVVVRSPAGLNVLLKSPQRKIQFGNVVLQRDDEGIWTNQNPEELEVFPDNKEDNKEESGFSEFNLPGNIIVRYYPSTKIWKVYKAAVENSKSKGQEKDTPGGDLINNVSLLQSQQQQQQEEIDESLMPLDDSADAINFDDFFNTDLPDPSHNNSTANLHKDTTAESMSPDVILKKLNITLPNTFSLLKSFDSSARSQTSQTDNTTEEDPLMTKHLQLLYGSLNRFKRCISLLIENLEKMELSKEKNIQFEPVNSVPRLEMIVRGPFCSGIAMILMNGYRKKLLTPTQSHTHNKSTGTLLQKITANISQLTMDQQSTFDNNNSLHIWDSLEAICQDTDRSPLSTTDAPPAGQFSSWSELFSSFASDPSYSLCSPDLKFRAFICYLLKFDCLSNFFEFYSNSPSIPRYYTIYSIFRLDDTTPLTAFLGLLTSLKGRNFELNVWYEVMKRKVVTPAGVQAAIAPVVATSTTTTTKAVPNVAAPANTTTENSAESLATSSTSSEHLRSLLRKQLTEPSNVNATSVSSNLEIHLVEILVEKTENGYGIDVSMSSEKREVKVDAIKPHVKYASENSNKFVVGDTLQFINDQPMKDMTFKQFGETLRSFSVGTVVRFLVFRNNSVLKVNPIQAAAQLKNTGKQLLGKLSSDLIKPVITTSGFIQGSSSGSLPRKIESPQPSPTELILEDVEIIKGENGFGLHINTITNKDGTTCTIIEKIPTNGPAYESGRLNVGDRVYRINGEDITTWTGEQVGNAFRANATIRLSVGANL